MKKYICCVVAAMLFWQMPVHSLLQIDMIISSMI